MSKGQECPAGAIEVYEVRRFRKGMSYRDSELLLVTDDKSKAESTALSQRGTVSRRFAVRLPGGRFWLLASVYPLREPDITRPHPPWCPQFITDAVIAENLAYDAEKGLLDDGLPKLLRRFARRFRLAASAMGGVQHPEAVAEETAPSA